jgi:Zn finger protein HypA/HybF involved in hydrogenase expression
MLFLHPANYDLYIPKRRVAMECPCGHVLNLNETPSECPECGMSTGDMEYFDEDNLTPEKELCFE